MPYYKFCNILDDLTKQNPAQQLLFSKFDAVLSKSAGRTLDMGWQGVFRRVILQLLPIDKLESEFSKTMGRPLRHAGFAFDEAP